MFEAISFTQALLTSFEAIGKLFMVIMLGAFLVRRHILSPDVVNGMTRTMIDVIVPCAIGVSMIRGFDFERLGLISPMLIFLPLVVISSTILSLLFFRLTAVEGRVSGRDRAATALASIPNSFYIPFPVALAMTPPEYHVLVGVILGAAVLAINPLQWTLGTWLVMGDRREAVSLRKTLGSVMNGPVLGVVVGAFLSLFPPVVSAAEGDPDSVFVLRMILGAAEIVGLAMAPMAMLLTGALIAQVRLGSVTVRRFVPIVFCRYLIMPGAIYLLIRMGEIPGGELLFFLLILEAASPPAMNLALAAKRFGGEWETASALSLWANLLGLIALPIWLALAMRPW